MGVPGHRLGPSGSSSFLLSQRMPPPLHCRNLHRATTTTRGSFPSRGRMCCFPCWLPTTSSTASGRCGACRSLASRGAGSSSSRGLGAWRSARGRSRMMIPAEGSMGTGAVRPALLGVVFRLVS